jgi:hypothetical protein
METKATLRSTPSLTSSNDNDAIKNTDPTLPFESVSGSSAATMTSSISFSPFTHHSFPISADLLPSPSTVHARDSRNILSVFPEDSGWIIGPNKELFLWIPADVRSSLWLPKTVTTDVASERKMYLDLSAYSCGSRWTECRRPLPSKQTHPDHQDGDDTGGQ